MISYKKLNKKLNIKEYGEYKQKLGNGGFGTVIHRGDVAVKIIKMEDFQSVEREISTLINLDHINIVNIIDVIIDAENVQIVLEKADYTLCHFIDTEYATNDEYDRKVKIISYQLVRAVAYCHSKKIIHRDIKPSNILIKNNNLVKLVDFGLARNTSTINKDVSHSIEMTTHMGTLPWMAPEILLGDKYYTYAVDNWSVGCVIAEMYNKGRIFLTANNNTEMLKNIFKILGTPTRERCEKFKRYPNILSTKKYYKDIIGKFLSLDPNNRLTSSEAINDDFFSSVKEEINKNYPILEQSSPKNDIDIIEVQPTNINSKMRTIVLNWMFDVVKDYRSSIRTYFLSVYLVDRYISLNPHTSKKYFQAVASMSYMLASNYIDIYPPKMSDLIYICDYAYNEQELIQIKNKIWCDIDYNLVYTLPYDYGMNYINDWVVMRKFKDILYKITISTYRCKYGDKNIISSASSHDFAISCIIACNKLLSLKNTSFDETCYHLQLAEKILEIYPKIKDTYY